MRKRVAKKKGTADGKPGEGCLYKHLMRGNVAKWSIQSEIVAQKDVGKVKDVDLYLETPSPWSIRFLL
jgi:hypothetical protein